MHNSSFVSFNHASGLFLCVFLSRKCLWCSFLTTILIPGSAKSKAFSITSRYPDLPIRANDFLLLALSFTYCTCSSRNDVYIHLDIGQRPLMTGSLVL